MAVNNTHHHPQANHPAYNYNQINQTWSWQNLKSILYAFCKGLADSIKFSDIFFLDSVAESRNVEKLAERDVKKDRLLNRDSPAPPDMERLAKRRALEKRSNANKTSANNPSETKIMERTVKCCILNGCFFWFSIVVFEYVMLPMIRNFIFLVLGEVAGSSMWESVVPVLSGVFATLWVLPLYLLSKVVNAIWFADIADSAFRKKANGRPRMMNSFSVSVADTVFTILVEMIFLMQAKLLSVAIPIEILGKAVHTLHMCLIHALYSFEYKWYNQGLELHKRLSFVECNWPYFLGFGLPLAFITSIPDSQVVSGCVFSSLFPLFLVSGNQAHVAVTAHDVAIRIFNPTIALSNLIFSRTLASAGAASTATTS